MRYLIIALIIIGGCQNVKQNKAAKLTELTKTLGNEDLSGFANYSAGIRSWEDRGKNVCIVVTNKEDTVCRTGFFIVVNVKQGSLLETRQSWDNEPCLFDTFLAKRMALKLNELKIASLTVQPDGSILVYTKYDNGGPDLVRLPESVNLSSEFKSWEPMDDGWYKRPE